jgi:hypothetical protein
MDILPCLRIGQTGSHSFCASTRPRGTDSRTEFLHHAAKELGKLEHFGVVDVAEQLGGGFPWLLGQRKCARTHNGRGLLDP